MKKIDIRRKLITYNFTTMARNSTRIKAAGEECSNCGEGYTVGETVFCPVHGLHFKGTYWCFWHKRR